MKNINKFLRQILFVLFTFVSIVAYSQIYFNPWEYDLGDVWGGDDIDFQFYVISNSSSPITCTVHIDEVLEEIPWVNWISPEFFTFNSEGETAIVEVNGTISTSFPTGINTFAINYYDFDYPYSLLGTFNIRFDFQGYPGIEDRVEISFGDYSFSEGDFLGYEGIFIDEDPYGDEVDEWNLKMKLFTDGGDYTYADITNTTGTWNFSAPEVPENMTFHRNEQGQILGVLTITGHDTDGYLHFATEYFGINKEPDEPILYIQPSNGTIDVHITNSGGTTNNLYYGVNTGDPYSGTGLNQGNSPINMGDNENITIDGFQNCSKYFFAVKSYNQLGTSDYSNEKSVRIFSPENGLPIQYHLSNCTIDSDYGFEGDHYFNGDLIIEAGAILNVVNGIMYFEENSKIIIEPGGQLILDGATCTAPCGQTWQGIEVRGNSAEHQFEYEGHPLAQGKLVLQNNASIQNAWNAVTTWKYDDWNTVGGIVVADNSSFINNKRSVEFMPYQNYHPFSGEPMGYESHFTNCQFIVDDNFVMPEFNSHITMNGVYGIQISGCEFTNNITDAQNTGQGIYTIDAGYRITDYCDATIQPCPDTSILHTTFNNFYAGIIALNSKSSNTIYVNDAEFVNNGIGIELNTVDNATVIYNDFYIGPDTYDSCFAGEFGIGIYLVNSNGYAIEENEFHTAQGMTGDAIGINVSYDPTIPGIADIMSNEIYKNTFDGVHIANNTQGNNFNSGTKFGLVHLCNENNNNDFDFYITDQGIQYMQGTLDEPAGNKFSLNANNQYSDYNNQSDWSILYFYEQNNTAETPESYTDESFFPIDVDSANQCQSHYGDITRQSKGLGLTVSQKQYFVDMYYSNLTDYLGTKALYESLKDGGDTPGTITDVEGAWPDEMWETRNDLLAKSPHLTREVLIETADRTDLFPDAVIFEILSANPDAMKDKTLLEYLETKEHPLPQYMIDILAESPGAITYKTILESDLAEYGRNKSRAANIIIRNMLNDSVVNTDSLIIWLNNLDNMAADYQVIDICLQKGDTTTALTLIDALPANYGFETDNAEYVRYKALKQLQVNLIAGGRNMYMLTPTEKSTLEDVAANSSGRSGMQARNILQFVYGNEYHDCPNMPDTVTYKSSKASIHDLASNMLEINVSPNPAKNWAVFNYLVPETSRNPVIEIYDLKGVLIRTLNISGYKGEKILDTRNMIPGVYMFTLKSSGMTKSGKLIITQ